MQKLYSIVLLSMFVALLTAACGTAPAVVDEPTENTTAADPPAEESSEAEQPEEPAVASGPFTIVSSESEVRFYIDEVLAGVDTRVLGVTNDVTGSITVDYANPAGVSMSEIVIGVNSLQTDSTNRTRAMHNNILQTGTYPTATFVATGFQNLPASVTIGESFDFQITGDLTIHGTTQAVTFDATVTPVSETRLEGIASLTVLYADYGISILRLPQQVASVENDVLLEIAFVAEQ